MAKSTEIKEALAAISSKPGASDYAAAAMALIEKGDLDQALKVCANGFATDPNIEQGAVVYLTALRKRGDVSKAAEVFGRGIAFNPKSAMIRVTWALILVDAGKPREAYNLTSEALELAPDCEEAKVLHANLAPSGQGDELPPPIPVQKAEVRPWVRPIGQRTTPHSMFDLTPAPFLMNAKEREGLHRGEVSIFDIPAPAVDEEEKYVEDDISNLDVEVPPDLFDDPSFPLESPTISPEEFDLVEPTQVTEPPPMELPVAAPPLRPVATPPPPIPSDAVLAPPDMGSDKIPILEPMRIQKPDDTLSEVMPTVVPLDPALESADSNGSSLMVLMPKRRLSRRWMGITLLALLVAGLGAGGVFGYAYWQKRALHEKVAQALQKTSADSYQSFLAARQLLAPLLAAHPQDQQVVGAMVLINAHLWSRFSAEDQFLTQAQELIKRAAASSKAVDASPAGAALLLLGQGKLQEAADTLSKSTTAGADDHARLAHILIARSQGQRARLEQLITDSTADPSRTSVGILFEASIGLRWLGDFKGAERIVDQGLLISPDHQGLLIQRGVVQVLRSLLQKVDVDLAALEASTKEIPRYRADLAFLRGLLAARARDPKEARRWTNEAHQLALKNAEYMALLGVAELGEGGDCTKAVALLQRALPERSSYNPALKLDLISGLILMGRPQQALELLVSTEEAQLAPPDMTRRQVLAVDLARLIGDDHALKQQCKPAAIKKTPQLRVPCAEAFITRPTLKLSSLKRRKIGDAKVYAYLRGLKALTAGDTARAISLLRKAPQRLGYHAAPLMALARSYSQQGDFATSIPLLRTAILLEARSIPSRTALAMALVDAGHDTEATSMLEEILKDKPTQLSIITRVGETFLTMGHPQKARDLITPVMKTSTSSASLQLLAGQIAMADNKIKAAQEHFLAALKLAPQNPRILVTIGRLENEKGKTARAKRRFAAALVIRPKDPEILTLVATAEASAKDYRGALAHGMKAVHIWNNSGQKQRGIEAMVQLGKMLAKGDKWARSRAGEILFEATKAKIPPVNAFLELGRVYRRNQDHARAVWCFRQVTAREPSLPIGHLELGLTLRKKPRWRAGAKTAFKRYLELSPKGKTSERVRKILAKMR